VSLAVHLAKAARDVPLTLVAAARCLMTHRYLTWQMVVRDVLGRYRGSVLGLLWTLVLPLLMLAVYTYVFGIVFRARWPDMAEASALQFAPRLFAGLIVHALFVEVLTRGPGIIVSQPNLVKRVVFPLETLSWIVVANAFFHAAISVLVLLVFVLVVNGALPWTVILVPVVLAAALPLMMGLCWFLSSLGVFLRDIGQLMGVLSTVLLFTAPVFYPASRAPEALQAVIVLNPITVIVEEMRAVAILGQLPDWGALGVYTLVGLIVASLGHAWFRKTHRAFADVL